MYQLQVWVIGMVNISAASFKNLPDKSSILKFERTYLLSFAVPQNQVSLTNRLKINSTNVNLQCFREVSKPYLLSLPDLNAVNTANHKRQFHKHCKCQ